MRNHLILMKFAGASVLARRFLRACGRARSAMCSSASLRLTLCAHTPPDSVYVLKRFAEAHALRAYAVVFLFFGKFDGQA